MAYVDVRLFTEVGQTAIIQPNETRDGIVLCTQEIEGGQPETRFYLTPDEAIELSKTLVEMVNRIK